MSITVVNLHDNRAVFQIFIPLLRFSFDSPLYNHDPASEACDLSMQYTSVGVIAVSGPFVFVSVSSL